MGNEALTPRQIVAELDKYIVGQKAAKRSVAIALRNRYRRSKLDESLREEIVPKNILMIGPTGVGKTEIARRLAKLVKAERTEQVKDKAEKQADERLVALLVPSGSKPKSGRNPLEMLFGNQQAAPQEEPELDASIAERRRQVREQLAAGRLENEMLEIDVEDTSPNMLDMLSGQGMEGMGMNMQEMFGQFLPKRTKKRKLPVKEARKVLTQEEAAKLIDMDEVISESTRRAEQTGIIFIDEIDKIASTSRGSGPDVSREGVQRDILPIVEGSTVITKYGPVKTDYVLFIAAGAFHVAKPADLIPELQGRFPIRVELSNLTLDDFVSILTEPKNALTKQYTALLETEGIRVEFAGIAADVNRNTENIGARRLHTILEKLLEDLSFEAPELSLEQITITPEYVRDKVGDIAQNRDLSQYIL